MPPKRTPSKEPATADPQIGQVLEMLQTLSAQMERLGERIGAVEKKSEAAQEAVAAIKRIDKGVSLESAREQKAVRRRRKLEGSLAQSSRGEVREAGDEEIISRGEHVVAKIGSHVKTVLTIMGSKRSSTKKAEQADYVESLKVAFETTMNGQIVSRNPRVWEVFTDEEKNGDEVFVQETEGRRRAKLVRSSSDPRKKERKKEASPRKAKEVLGSKRKQFVARKSLRSHGERRRRWKVRLKEQKTPFRE